MEIKNPLDPIPSPYNVSTVTDKVLEKVKELTGASCVFIVISNEEPNHECVPEKCTGHILAMNISGFSDVQIMGIAAMIADKGDMKIVSKDEEDL